MKKLFKIMIFLLVFFFINGVIFRKISYFSVFEIFISSAYANATINNKKDNINDILPIISNCDERDFKIKSLIYYAQFQNHFEYRNLLENKGIEKLIENVYQKEEISELIDNIMDNLISAEAVLSYLKEYEKTENDFNGEYIDNKITIVCSPVGESIDIYFYSGCYIFEKNPTDKLISGEIVWNNNRYSFFIPKSLMQKIFNMTKKVFNKKETLDYYKLNF